MTNGKIKKVSGFISFIIVCAITLGLIVSVNAKSVAAENDKTEFSSEITAVSHAHGEKINILPEEVRLFNESKQFDPEYLKGLYEYTDFHREFSIIDNERLVEVYRETDAFNPVNNVLKWQSSLENVRFYKVRVAYDNKFKECVLIVDDADINAGITLENPLTGTTYYWQVIATLNSGDKVYSPIFDFTVENSLRTITVDGVSNIRDIGGYETAYGYIRQGLVYRSARLESITTDGLTVFKDKLGVKTELDLRGEAEIANFTTNIENAAGLEKHFVFDTPFYASEGEVEFSDGINGRNNWQNVKNIMSVFADKENYPIDFHCAVGRDRTGTVATLLKALLGFNEQDIINDYFTTMFSTTGAWSKSVFNNNKDGITFLLKYLNSFDGDTLADKTAEYLIAKCGMTQTQIDDIRNIMTGQEG
ncbi:MAG: tyrosine-protein phosphatase, partial [Clostridia bacterium]|nr:tyrosine-protein phosphatase [Clostridia bacterium]